MTIMKISRPLICLIGMVICVLVGCVGFARADLVGHETFDRTTHRTSRSEGDLARASSVKGDLPPKVMTTTTRPQTTTGHTIDKLVSGAE